MKKFALIGLLAASALMVGCASTQCRDGSCEGDKVCATACDHANAPMPCPKCEPGKPCCAKCATKMAETCPDCMAKKAAGEHAMACPDCKDGKKMCAECKAKAAQD